MVEFADIINVTDDDVPELGTLPVPLQPVHTY
jgi:hypothetical protein